MLSDMLDPTRAVNAKQKLTEKCEIFAGFESRVKLSVSAVA